MRAGLLDKRVTFRRPAPRVDDGAGGNADRAWSEAFKRQAGLLVARGQEARDAGAERSPRMGTLTVRRDKQTVLITPAWSVVIVFAGQESEWNIRSVNGFDRRSGMISMAVESGVPV
jgi:head-tail joining protein